MHRMAMLINEEELAFFRIGSPHVKIEVLDLP